MQLGAIEPTASKGNFGISAADIDFGADHENLKIRVAKLESDIKMYKMLLIAAVVIYFLTKQK